MNHYSKYEIRQVVERDGVVAPVNYEPVPDGLTPFWALYGHRRGTMQAIGDFTTYEDVRTAYRLLTGVDCGAEPRDHYGLPSSWPDRVHEARRKDILEIAMWRIGCNENIQLDDDADFSEGEPNPYTSSTNGAYIQTWFWVNFSDTKLDKAVEKSDAQP